MMRIKSAIHRHAKPLKKTVYSFLDNHPFSYRRENGFGYLLRNATIDYEKAAWADVAKDMPTVELPLSESKVVIVDTAAWADSLYTVRPEQMAKLDLTREEKLEFVNWSNSRQEQDRFDFLRRHPRIKQLLDHTVEVAKVKNYKPDDTAVLMAAIGTLGSAVHRRIKIERGYGYKGIYKALYREDMKDLREHWYSSAQPKIKLHAVEVVSEIFKDRGIVEKVADEVS